MKTSLLAFVALIVATTHADADTYGMNAPGLGPRNPLGAYACVVHRAVGFQGDKKTGLRFAGAITLPDEQAKFTLTIKQRDDGLIGSKYCTEAKPEGPDGLKYVPGKPEPKGMLYSSDYDFWFTCKANNELTLSPSKHSKVFRGDDRNLFIGPLPFDVFHLFVDLSFLSKYGDFSGNFYMEEGQCQRI